MTTLYPGLVSDEVKRWEYFLLGNNYGNLVVDGVYDSKTIEATKNFQSRFNLVVDGIAGKQTLEFAKKKGFQLEDDELQPYSYREREKVFGSFSYVSSPEKGNEEAITIDKAWVSENIVKIEIPQFEILKNICSSKIPKSILVNKLMVDPILEFFCDLESDGLLEDITSFDGAWVPRFVRGSRTYLSNHAWGTAFDINAKFNPLGTKPMSLGREGSVLSIVPIANKCGLFWGGNFKDRVDGMHFELGKK